MSSVIVLRPVFERIEPVNQDSLNRMKHYTSTQTSTLLVPDLWTDLFVEGCPQIQVARNTLVEMALARDGWTHALFVDADMGFPQDALKKLVHDDKPIVGVQYLMRSPPFYINAWGPPGTSMVMKQVEKPMGPGTREVSAIGMGLTLINREVFETMKEDWFSFKEFEGEDVEFCVKAYRLGFSTWMNCDIHMKHIGRHAYEVGA